MRRGGTLAPTSRLSGRFGDPVYRHRALQLAADAVLAAAAFALAFQLRFLDASGGIPHRYLTMLAGSVAFVAIGTSLVYEVLGLHRDWWRYFRLPELWPLVRAAALASALVVAVFVLAKPYAYGLPRSVIVFNLILTGGADRRCPAAGPDVGRAAQPRGATAGQAGDPRDRRGLGRPDGGAGAPAQPQPRRRARSVSWTTIRASGACTRSA